MGTQSHRSSPAKQKIAEPFQRFGLPPCPTGMKISTLATILISTLLASGCKESNQQELSEGLQIRVGRICGWCAGEDVLALSAETYAYAYDHACEDELDVAKQFYDTPKQDWHELINHYDQQAFAKEDLNTCNVCADGCDSWVKVTDGEFEHEIRFGSPDQIADRNVRVFSKKLISLIEEAREKFRKD